MKIYLIEKENNKELYNYLKRRYVIERNINYADVIIVDKVKEINKALCIIDFALMKGKEILCIKNNFRKEDYVCNHLIKDGAQYV